MPGTTRTDSRRVRGYSMDFRNQEEKDMVRQAAFLMGLTVSMFLRKIALKEAKLKLKTQEDDK